MNGANPKLRHSNKICLPNFGRAFAIANAREQSDRSPSSSAKCNFVKEKCPTKPLHSNCHCDTININPIAAIAECSIEKFTKYIFIASAINNKKLLFELWGYDIMDSKYLQQEFINQARLAYSVGDYELGLLNEYGQRINIVIKLKRKSTNDYVSFRSGWMVYPNGKIVLTTPYGRK